MVDQDANPDPAEAGRDFTKQCHELAPRLWGMVQKRFVNLDDAKDEFAKLPLAELDTWAQLAAWHLRQILETKERTAREIVARKLEVDRRRLETTIPGSKLEVVEIVQEVARILRGHTGFVRVVLENTQHGVKVEVDL